MADHLLLITKGGEHIAKQNKKLNPGTPAPESGQYKVVGESREITAVKGKSLPPGRKSGTKYVLVDKTKH